MPLDWARTQNNLGNALTLGERESGTAHLEEAVAAFRAALEEIDAQAVPLQSGGDADEPRQCAARRLGASGSGTASSGGGGGRPTMALSLSSCPRGRITIQMSVAPIGKLGLRCCPKGRNSFRLQHLISA